MIGFSFNTCFHLKHPIYMDLQVWPSWPVMLHGNRHSLFCLKMFEVRYKIQIVYSVKYAAMPLAPVSYLTVDHFRLLSLIQT